MKKKQFDQDALIFCAGLSDDEIRQAVIKFRNPAKGIHIEPVKRDRESNHIVHIIAPDFKIWKAVKRKFMRLEDSK